MVELISLLVEFELLNKLSGIDNDMSASYPKNCLNQKHLIILYLVKSTKQAMVNMAI